VPIPPTFVGPTGQKFFVGVHMAHTASAPPAPIDRTMPHQHRSWFAYGSNLANLGANPTPPTLTDALATPGDWSLRAFAGSPNDTNGNGLLDACESCTADINLSHTVDVNDLLIIISHWGPCPGVCPPACAGDVVVNCTVDVNDLLTVISQWGTCP
jgi:hypothetical protein